MSLPEVERLIAEGQSPLDLRRFFKSFKDAVQFYAAFRARQYGLATAIQTCCDCGQPAGDASVAEIIWGAPFARVSAGRVLLLLLGVLTALVGHLHIHLKVDWVVFSSFHGFCPTCWRRYRRFRWFKIFLEAVSTLCIFAGLFAFIGGGAFALFDDHPKPAERQAYWIIFALGVLMLLSAAIIRIGFRMLGIPAAIRLVAPRPFRQMKTMLMQTVVLAGTPQRIIHVPRYRPQNPGAMSWQQTVGVLVTLFAGVPAAFMAFTSRSDSPYRLYGFEMLGGWLVLMIVLTVWHQMRQKKIRDAHYLAMAQQFADRIAMP